MMGTSVIYSSGDYGVAGQDNVCLNSNRMYWSPSIFFLFSTFLYQDQPDRNGTVFSPEFPVGAQLVFIHSK